MGTRCPGWQGLQDPGWGWSKGGGGGLYWTALRVLGREAREGAGVLANQNEQGWAERWGDSHPQEWGGGPQGSCGSPDLVVLSQAQGKLLQGQAE